MMYHSFAYRLCGRLPVVTFVTLDSMVLVMHLLSTGAARVVLRGSLGDTGVWSRVWM